MNKEQIIKIIKKSKREYYVYALLRNGVPFYVGKGKAFRIFEHKTEATKTNANSHKLNIIRKLLKGGKEIEYKIYKFFEDDINAWKLEIKLIHEYGRLIDKSGILTNVTKGGDGVLGGIEIQERIKKGVQKYIKNNPEKFKENQRLAIKASRTPEAREKNRQAKLEWFRDNPDKVELRRQKIKETCNTPETKELFSKCQKLRFSKKEEIEKCSKAQKKRFKDPIQRDLAKQKAFEAGKRRKEIKNRCTKIIKDHNLNDILPNGRSSIQTFLDFEQYLLRKIS